MQRDLIASSKPLVFSICLIPAAWLIWDTLNQTLGSDPVAQLQHRSGDWALRFLLLTLTLTPLRRITGWHKWVRYRRMLGLFALFYASGHLFVYLAIDLGGFWSHIFAEIIKRPYLSVGFAAWLLMLPLAITSTKAMMKRLGRNWQRLHRLVYLIAPLGILHYLWLVKSDIREPLLYAGIFILLMLLRIRRVK